MKRLFFVLVLWSAALTACGLGVSAPQTDIAPAAAQVSEKPSAVSRALSFIAAGDFNSAQTALAEPSDEPSAEVLRSILARFNQYQQWRQQEIDKARQEQMAELEKIEKQVAQEGAELSDQQLQDAMSAILRVSEYLTEDAKQAFYRRPFVASVIEKVRQRGAKLEQEGKWIEAYSKSAAWLAELFTEDKSYKEAAERLSDLASIELSLKDSGCGETAVERYKGIKSEMLVRALNVLATNYVHPIDYRQMLDKALRRCSLLGEVLLADAKRQTQPAAEASEPVADTQTDLSDKALIEVDPIQQSKPLAWRVEPATAQDWIAGIEALTAASKEIADLSDRQEAFLRFFEDVLKLNSSTLKLPQEVVIAHFSEAALSALDPFTTLVWPWNVSDFEKSMTQQFSGIGIEISKRTGVLKIVSLLPDTPAYKSGLDADDEILAVNGESTKEMTIFCAVSKITGPKGTKVTLTIRRPSTGKTWDVTIVRDKIVVQPLRGWQRKEDGSWDYFIDPENKIGYIRLTAFTETSGPDLDKTLKTLEKQGLSALILDLRFNSGGYLTSAAEVVDLFVSQGVIVKSNPRHGFATYEIAHRSGTHPDYPLIVLINGSSASASEIVAGALQDPQHKRAVLVGERSYGKGSVQVVTPYTGGGSQLKYTVAYYHLPSDQQVKNRYQMEREGRTDWGIAPDVEVKMYSHELRAMLDMQRDNDVLFRADHQQDGAPTVRHSLEKTLAADPQLFTALAVIQSQLAGKGKSLTLAAEWQPPAEVFTVSAKEDKKN